MNEYRKIFEEYGALHIGQILSKQECNDALLFLLKEKENGNFIKDLMGFEYSFNNDELSYLLEKIKPKIEKILNIQIFPTYAYSRIYQKGDILPVHIDRNSCEISITITLGYEGDSVWPFVILPKNETLKYINPIGIYGDDYIGEIINITPDISKKLKRISIDVGDGILYKGMEIGHGRDEYIEGIWQAQLFLHYVDANGSNKHHKGDQNMRGILYGSGD